MTPLAVQTKTVLHIGCGPESVFDRDGACQFSFEGDWREIRVDLDPAWEPDVVADAAALPFDAASADVLVCMACLEHLPEARAGEALQEFHRVLRPNGELVLQVPNLELAARMIAEGRGWETLYDSPAGPIRALDLIYGGQRLVNDNPLMAHHTGFTAASLGLWLWQTGFDGQITSNGAELWVYATKCKPYRERAPRYLHHMIPEEERRS